MRTVCGERVIIAVPGCGVTLGGGSVSGRGLMPKWDRRPRVAASERVEVQPVLDLTRLAVVGLLLAGNDFGIRRTVRVPATRRPSPRA